MSREITNAGSPMHSHTEDTAKRPAASTRRRRWFLAATVALSVLLVATTATGAATRVYTIVYGDTLNEIAAEHGTDVSLLTELNGLEDPDLIIAGEDLVLPDGEPTTYTVEEGDSLAEIATAHDVSIDEIVAVNKIENADLIQIGDTLLIFAPANGTGETEEQATDSEAVSSEESTEPVDDGEEAVEDAPESSEDSSGPDTAGSASGRLHLVVAGETIEDVAVAYGVTVDQLVAANALESTEISAGMILKIPLSGSSGVELVGMPTGQEQWPLMSELAAASIATAYWGAPISSDQLLEMLDHSENPHLGFRGDPQGMFGTTDDYGVYNTPLADALTSFGFSVEAFYADGDRTALISQLDSGVPVVVWVTHNLTVQERIVVESDLGRYSLIPEQHAVLVYGYDDSGIRVMDVGSGSSTVWSWDAFMDSWSLFDGMALAIDLQ